MLKRVEVWRASTHMPGADIDRASRAGLTARTLVRLAIAAHVPRAPSLSDVECNITHLTGRSRSEYPLNAQKECFSGCQNRNQPPRSRRRPVIHRSLERMMPHNPPCSMAGFVRVGWRGALAAAKANSSGAPGDFVLLYKHFCDRQGGFRDDTCRGRANANDSGMAPLGDLTLFWRHTQCHWNQ